MLLTLYREPIIEVVMGLEQIEKRLPSCLSLLALHECFHISNQHEAVAGSCDKNIQAFRSRHEADVPGLIAASEGRNDNVTFFALVIVWVVVSSRNKI